MLALESATQIGGDLELRGIDLDSGQRISITVTYEPEHPTPGSPLNGLILSLSVIESPLTN